VPGYYKIASAYGERIHPISQDKIFYTGVQIPVGKG
jgi:murein DD-endopeptidase MepM/ murein hydrolase activator NlpD